MLIDKYAPQSLNEILLDDKTTDNIIAWINSWNRGLPSIEKPSLLLTGFPGTGKTTAAKCICNDADWFLIEFNASDSRRKEDLEGLTIEKSLMGNITCVLFDEADSLEIDGKYGENFIKNIIKERNFPVILTANNIFKVPKEIKALCETLQIYRPSANALKMFLYNICKKEGLNPSNEILEAAAQCQDYRMGLSMIENNTILLKNKTYISKEEATKCLVLNIETNIEDPKPLIYYLDANCSSLYDPLELYQIYEILIKADIHRRRGQTKHSVELLKSIPKTTSNNIEIIQPIYIDRKKKVSKI